MAEKAVTKLIDALTARTHFGAMMESAEKENTRFLVSRRGKPKVVVLSVRDYLQNVLKKPSLLAEIQAEAQKAGLDRMTDAEIEAEIAAERRKPE